LANLIGLIVMFPSGAERAGKPAAQRLAGHATATTEAACDVETGESRCLSVTVRMADGPLAGQELLTLESLPGGSAAHRVGDDVVLLPAPDARAPADYQIVDFQRGPPLLSLALVFAVAVVALGRWRGAAALVALGLTGAVLATFVLPAILAGRDPLAVVGSCLIMFGALYLTHGVTARTSAALLGTLASLLLIEPLGVGFAAVTRLTGADEDTASLAKHPRYRGRRTRPDPRRAGHRRPWRTRRRHRYAPGHQLSYGSGGAGTGSARLMLRNGMGPLLIGSVACRSV
jgi:uncharacterized membrane protein